MTTGKIGREKEKSSRSMSTKSCKTNVKYGVIDFGRAYILLLSWFPLGIWARNLYCLQSIKKLNSLNFRASTPLAPLAPTFVIFVLFCFFVALRPILNEASFNILSAIRIKKSFFVVFCCGSSGY